MSYPTKSNRIASPLTGAADAIIGAASEIMRESADGVEQTVGQLTLGVTIRAKPSLMVKADSFLARTTPIVRTTIVPDALVPASMLPPNEAAYERSYAYTATDWALMAAAIGNDASMHCPEGSVLRLLGFRIPDWSDDVTIKSRVFTLNPANPTKRLATVGLLVADPAGEVFDVPDALFWMTFNFGLAVDGVQYETYSPNVERK